MTAVAASIRRSAERATLELPFAVPAKEWFTLREVAALSGMSESYVEKKFDEGKQLSGHVHNGGAGHRNAKRVPRAWLISWLLQTAAYDDTSLDDALIAILPRRPAASLVRIAAAATRLAHERPLSASHHNRPNVTTR